MKNIVIVLMIAANWVTSVAADEFKRDNLVIDYDPETGVARAEYASAANGSTPKLEGDGTAASQTLSWSTIANQGLAYYDSTGKLTEVFPAPQTVEDQQFVFDKLKLGGGQIQTVSLFSFKPELPSSEDVQRITHEAISAALETVCSIRPRPEKLKFDVSLEAGLGLSGKFNLSMDWMPARDCGD